MIDSFKVKAALKQIGSTNPAYASVFKEYEGLEKANVKLEKQMQTVQMKCAEMQAQLEIHKEKLENQGSRDYEGEIKTLEMQLATSDEMVNRLRHDLKHLKSMDSDKEKHLHAKLEELKKEHAEAMHEKEQAFKDAMAKMKEKQDEDKKAAFEERQALQAEIGRLKDGAGKHFKELEDKLKQCNQELEEKNKELEELRGSKGNFDNLNKTQLQIVARKKGWDLKVLPYFLKEQTVDIDSLQSEVQALRRGSQVIPTSSGGDSEELIRLRKKASELETELAKAKNSMPAPTRAVGEDENSLQSLQLKKDLMQAQAALDEQSKQNAKLAEDNKTMRRRLKELEGAEKYKEENAQLKVAIEELRLRLAKLQQLAQKNGQGGELKKMMEESGLELGGGMQSWLLQNVFERLYQDAVNRHDRTRKRFEEMQQKSMHQALRMTETMHLRKSASMGSNLESPKGFHTTLMTFDGVAFGEEDESVRKARARVDDRLHAMAKRTFRGPASPVSNDKLQTLLSPMARSEPCFSVATPQPRTGTQLEVSNRQRSDTEDVLFQEMKRQPALGFSSDVKQWKPTGPARLQDMQHISSQSGFRPLGDSASQPQLHPHRSGLAQSASSWLFNGGQPAPPMTNATLPQVTRSQQFALTAPLAEPQATSGLSAVLALPAP